MADRYAQLDALYAELPRLECRGKCQESCGPIDAATADLEAHYAVAHTELDEEVTVGGAELQVA